MIGFAAAGAREVTKAICWERPANVDRGHLKRQLRSGRWVWSSGKICLAWRESPDNPSAVGAYRLLCDA